LVAPGDQPGCAFAVISSRLFAADPSEFCDSTLAKLCPAAANASPNGLRSVPPPDEWQTLQRAPLVDHAGAAVPIATLEPVVEAGYRALNCVRYELRAMLDVDHIDIPAATDSTAITSKTRLLPISISLSCSVKLRDVTDSLSSNLRRPHF
jgi:hypothetical protein